MIADQDMRGTIGAGLRRDRIDFGLTPSQKAYCRARADGMRPIDAYRFAYPNDTSLASTLSGAAAYLEADGRVVELVAELQAEKGGQTNLVPQVERIEVSKDWVVQGIARLAADEKVKHSTRLSAYIAVGKSAGVDAFRDIVVHEKRTRTLEEIDREIARHLAGMIDVTPNAPGSSLPVIEQEAKPSGRDRRRKPVT